MIGWILHKIETLRNPDHSSYKTVENKNVSWILLPVEFPLNTFVGLLVSQATWSGVNHSTIANTTLGDDHSMRIMTVSSWSKFALVQSREQCADEERVVWLFYGWHLLNEPMRFENTKPVSTGFHIIIERFHARASLLIGCFWTNHSNVLRQL